MGKVPCLLCLWEGLLLFGVSKVLEYEETRKFFHFCLMAPMSVFFFLV